MAEGRLTVLGVVGPSGAGKTTLLEALIPRLGAMGLRIAAVKHSHHDFEVDRPGKDSHRLRRAGAREVILASRHRLAHVVERAPGAGEAALEALLGRLDRAHLDLVLVEGFKAAPIPKLEVHRPALGRPPLYPEDAHVLAVVTDAPAALADAPAVLPLDAPGEVARFVAKLCRWTAPEDSP